jgi:hypothetical protein
MSKPKPPSEPMPEVMQPSELPLERLELGLGQAPDKLKAKITVKTISATYERKFNLGEYESASLGVTTWADIEPEQDPAAAITELQELCKAQVKKQALPILKGRKNGGAEYNELLDSYSIIERILEDALTELTLQEPHDEEYKALVERLNALTGSK